MIYVSDNLYEKLSKEGNASELISSLLETHYKFNLKKVDDIESTQRKIEEERKAFIEKYSEDYALLEKQKVIIKQKEDTIQEQEAKIKNKRQELINNINLSFLGETGRNMTEQEVKEYLWRWDNETGFNFFKYMEEVKEKQK